MIREQAPVSPWTLGRGPYTECSCTPKLQLHSGAMDF